MSKKKNTLKDLDEFLKQQAATLVSPPQLSEKVDTLAPSRKKAAPAPETTAPQVPPAAITFEGVLNDLKALSEQDKDFRKKLYDLVISSLESQPQSLPEDKMLINTALYLKSGDQWKDTIRAYWKQKP